MVAHVHERDVLGILGLTSVVLMASCSSHALRGHPVDAAGTGGTTEARGGAGGTVDAWFASVGGQFATGGRIATGGESAVGGGVGGASSSGGCGPRGRGARRASDCRCPAAARYRWGAARRRRDSRCVATAPAGRGRGGFGEAGSPLAAFCVGSESKIAYGGQSFVVPVTTKTALLTRDCCMDYEARLHSMAAIGEDLDVVVRPPPRCVRAPTTRRTGPRASRPPCTAAGS